MVILFYIKTRIVENLILKILLDKFRLNIIDHEKNNEKSYIVLERKPYFTESFEIPVSVLKTEKTEDIYTHITFEKWFLEILTGQDI